MYVAIDLSSQATTRAALAEPEDFTSFKVVIRNGADADRLAEALAPLGRLDSGGDAYIAPQALRDLAGERAKDPEWSASLDTMIGYASSKGWVDPATGAIQAHLEWAGA